MTAPDFSQFDLDTLNEDWIKTRTWDLPTTLDELLAAVGEDGAIAILDLPSGIPMPADLRAQVEELRDTRTS